MKKFGYYENAEKIVQVPVAVITAIGTVMLPRISNMLSNQKEQQVKEIMEKTVPFMLFMAFPMMMGILAISKEFSVMFLGEGFAKSGILMQLLAVTIIFFAWGDAIRNQYLIPKEKDKEVIISSFLGAGINFILNYILIKKYAAIGACIGTIVAEFSVVFYQTWVIRKELNIRKYIGKSIPFLWKSLVMVIIVSCIKYINIDNNVIKVICQIVCGALVYTLLNIKYILDDLGLKKYIKNITGKVRRY